MAERQGSGRTVQSVESSGTPEIKKCGKNAAERTGTKRVAGHLAWFVCHGILLLYQEGGGRRNMLCLGRDGGAYISEHWVLRPTRKRRKSITSRQKPDRKLAHESLCLRCGNAYTYAAIRTPWGSKTFPEPIFHMPFKRLSPREPARRHDQDVFTCTNPLCAAGWVTRPA